MPQSHLLIEQQSQPSLNAEEEFVQGPDCHFITSSLSGEWRGHLVRKMRYKNWLGAFIGKQVKQLIIRENELS